MDMFTPGAASRSSARSILLPAFMAVLLLAVSGSVVARAATTPPPGAPSAPTMVGARESAPRAGGATVTVQWSAPTETFGSAVTGYVVTPFIGSVAYAPRTFAATATSGLVAGLAFAKTYTFQVAATNANGTGAPSGMSPALKLVCIGKALTRGQLDINAAPSGTTFCLSGWHNWSLTPKSGDAFIGPAILDGAHTTVNAFIGNGTSNVALSTLDVRNYRVTDASAAISAHGTTGWIFRYLQVHDNGTAAGGTGANLGVNSRVIGGRYYANRELGIGGGGGANGWIIDGAQIDHNNFTNDSYTTRNINCGYQAGGVKWTADFTTVKNSRIHDNACKGLWADLNGDNARIVNNQIYNNWDEGVFIEISSGAVITGNYIYGNGHKNYNSGGSGCSWLWGGGITLASSDHAVIAYNMVSGNCNGITGTQQNRSDGHPGLLEYEQIHDNAVYGPGGKTGAVADNGADLTTRSIAFTKNTFGSGTMFCSLWC